MVATKKNTRFAKKTSTKPSVNVAGAKDSASAKVSDAVTETLQFEATTNSTAPSKAKNEDAAITKSESGSESKISTPEVKTESSEKSETGSTQKSAAKSAAKSKTKKTTTSKSRSVSKANAARSTKSAGKGSNSVTSPATVTINAANSSNKVKKAVFMKTETESEQKDSTPVVARSPEAKTEIQPSQNIVAKPTPQPTDASNSKTEFGYASIMEIFNMQNLEIPFAIRDVAEQGIEQARAAYEKVKSATEAASSALEDSIESSRKHTVKINDKVLDAAKANTSATFDFYKDAIAVKSVGEVLELQSEFAQKQFTAATKQSKEIHELTSKFATEFTAPAKEAISKAFGVQAN